MSDSKKATGIEGVIQAAIEIRTERNILEDSVGGGEIQWAEAMTEPVNKLVVALNAYQIDDTFNDDTPAQTFGPISDDDMNNVPFASFDLAAGEDKTLTCDFFAIADDEPMHLIGIAGPARALQLHA